MVTLQEIRINNLISIMPCLILIIAIILYYVSYKLDKRIPSQYIANVVLKMLSIPLILFSPYLFIISLSENALYLFMTGIYYYYWVMMYASILVLFLYGFEYLLKNFLMVELYMDGVKIKWQKLLK